ncbi:MAG TPA: PLP-dependent aminotransferase family protein [Gammaproteobacteria bacterium]
MKEASGIPFSAIVFDDAGDAPRYRQLYAHIRDLILTGSMPAGLRLPSSRELATEIGVSRNTVIAAYELLVDEQFAESITGRGTVVRDIPTLAGDVVRNAGARTATESTPMRMPFAVPDAAHFPVQAWTRVLRNSVKRSHPANERPRIGGDARLRKLICAYLGAYRGLRCREEQVLITTGGQQGLYLAGKVLREFTNDVLIEDPGYLGARNAFLECGFRLHPVPVDDAGACLESEQLSRVAGSHAIYLTPSHQFPMGPTLSLERRMDVLNRAQEQGNWIIEDDYDAEYRYDGKPLTALAGLDVTQRVIYIGTFSKVLSPDLRVGYIVVPDALIDKFRAIKESSDGAAPVLMQTAIADFLQDGYFQAHLRRMREVYRDKRDRLIELLDAHELPITIQPQPAGMHVTLMLDEDCSDVEVSKALAERGFEAPALSRHYLPETIAKQGLLVGFTNADNADLQDFAIGLAAILLQKQQHD